MLIYAQVENAIPNNSVVNGKIAPKILLFSPFFLSKWMRCEVKYQSHYLCNDQKTVLVTENDIIGRGQIFFCGLKGMGIWMIAGKFWKKFFLHTLMHIVLHLISK